MKMDDLKNFDFKNIDLSKVDINSLSTQFFAKKDVLGQMIVIVISVFCLISVWGSHQSQVTENQQAVEDLNKKLNAIKGYEVAIEKSKSFMETLPKEIDEDQISTQIADYALPHNIDISSFSPGTRVSQGLSELISLQITAAGKTYNDLLYFLQAIESSPYAFRVESCSIMPDRLTDGVTADIRISYVKLKK